MTSDELEAIRQTEEADAAGREQVGITLHGMERCPYPYCWKDGWTDVAGGYPVPCMCHDTPGWVGKGRV